MNFKKNELTIDNTWQLFLVMCALVAITTMPDLSYASDGISGTLCKVTTLLTGALGKGIATVAVVVLGVGLFLGKLSWGLAIATALGIGMIFSAGKIVNWLGGSSSTASCPS